jgi:hypothetical protein
MVPYWYPVLTSPNTVMVKTSNLYSVYVSVCQGKERGKRKEIEKKQEKEGEEEEEKEEREKKRERRVRRGGKKWMRVENLIHDYSTFQVNNFLLVSDSRILSLHLSLKFISSIF